MTRTIILIAALFGATTALAEVEDTDGNGTYSMEELKAAYPDLTEDTFAIVDVNGDGAVDTDELAAAENAGLLKAG